MPIASIDQLRFNALAGYTRHPYLASLVQEYDWLATDDERVLAVLTWDRFDHDFGWIAGARDQRRRYRAVAVNSSLPTTGTARAELMEAMARLQAAPDEEFFQGDEDGEPIDFFAVQGAPNKLHRNFKLLLEHPRYSPARELITAMMPYFEDVDGNFVEQFQTAGFDPRIWELYLFATFTELGFVRDKTVQVPDFVLGGLGGRLAVEATTANPPDGGQAQIPQGAEEIRAYLENFIPIKLARALKRKLNREPAYWADPALENVAFVLAVQDFHAAGSMRMITPAATEYCFGVRHDIVDGQLRIQWIDEHRYAGAVEPSGFFQLPNGEHVSAVLINPQGTLVKFNRLGYLAGFGDPRVRMIKTAFVRRDAEGERRPKAIVERLEDPHYSEAWVEGMVVLHNPNALRPLDPHLLPGATHEFLQPDGRIMSLLAERPVYFSQTNIGPEDDHGPESEEDMVAAAS